MRSSILLALGVLVLAASVEGIFRPANYKPHYYGGGGGKPDDCDNVKSTKKAATTEAPTTAAPTTEAPTTTVAPTTTTTAAPTTTHVPACPTGFIRYNRVPTAANNYTSVWCANIFFTENFEPMAVADANAFCATKAPGAVLTSFENENERNWPYQELSKVLYWDHNLTSGAVAIDGRRNANCVSRNRTVLDSLPCSDPTQVYHLTDGHTDPSYMWSIWAPDEPSANMWTYDIEECLQMAGVWPPGGTPRANKLNDIYCNFVKPPNDETYTLYWNFGAICGVLPS